MKNASSKTNNFDSPKTPGGIRKSLLTPCRRLGLSKKWKKGGVSPFISPLASSVNDQEKIENRKRKELASEDCVKTPESANEEIDINNDSTPSRNVALPRRKKTKTLLSAINSHQTNNTPESPIKETNSDHNDSSDDTDGKTVEKVTNEKSVITTPVRTPKRGITLKSQTKEKNIIKENSLDNPKNKHNNINKDEESNKGVTKERSPNDLKKECFIIIQKEIFEADTYNEKSKCDENETTVITQTLDSDLDNMPLSNLNKTLESSQKSDDFITQKSGDVTPKSRNNSKKLKTKPKDTKAKIIDEIKEIDYDDDDDFAETKKTILLRKTYSKVTKPVKAKSTGSITLKDIEDLKLRIETKKKLLLTQSITDDTKELRDLIKKWQKGCQNALMELMDLMKSKFPEKSNMDYLEILKILNIPAPLVGYDCENHCFNTPEDSNIILASLSDI